MPLRVILNPAASGGRGAGLRPQVEAELERRRVPFVLTQTRAAGHARALALEMAGEGVERILVVGGDGTIHEVANGMLEGGGDLPVLGVIPVGTGNDFFRMVGPHRDVPRAMGFFLQGEVHPFDVGRVRWDGGERFFVNLLGVGIDVFVLEKRESFSRLRGLPQYLAAFTSALASFRPEAYRISIEGSGEEAEAEVFGGRTILTTFTVGPSIGGGFMVNPGASPFDGRLDLFSVEAVGLLKIARFVPMVVKGTHQGVPEIKLRKLRRGVIERPDGAPFHFELDGERMPDPVGRLEIDLVEGALPVAILAPEEGGGPR